MSVIRNFERRQPSGPVGGEAAGFHRGKEAEAARAAELAFCTAMIAARRQGLEKFTLGPKTKPGTERPRFVLGETVSCVCSNGDYR